MSQPIAVVTGASRGIGAATARRLANEGFAVCINYRSDEAAAASLLREIRAVGVAAIAVQADVSSDDDVTRLFATVDRELGPVTALVNNAAIVMEQARVADLTARRINRILEVNVTGAFVCAREAVRRMSTKLGGSGASIVNVSSAAARIGSPNEYVDYAASKAALDTLTRGLALEVAADGIRVNGVRPGFIYTDMHEAGGEPDRVDRLKSTVPMRRGGYPEEAASAVAWLLSDDASYSTGTFIDVSGGR